MHAVNLFCYRFEFKTLEERLTGAPAKLQPGPPPAGLVTLSITLATPPSYWLLPAALLAAQPGVRGSPARG